MGGILLCFMPYVSSLKSFAEWYVQLLSESLGKRKRNEGEFEYFGRTPVCAIGTTDMHSQTQQHIHGKPDKVLTFVEVEDFQDKELAVPGSLDYIPELSHISRFSMGHLLRSALKANRDALAEEGRPSVTLKLPVCDAYHLGQLIYFFQYSIAFEGALWGIDAFDQPGVES